MCLIKERHWFVVVEYVIIWEFSNANDNIFVGVVVHKQHNTFFIFSFPSISSCQCICGCSVCTRVLILGTRGDFQRLSSQQVVENQQTPGLCTSKLPMKTDMQEEPRDPNNLAIPVQVFQGLLAIAPQAGQGGMSPTLKAP